MFERLIESGRESRRKRTGGYLLGASLVYLGALVGAASLAIMWFNPGLVEAFELNARLAPPPPFAMVVTRTMAQARTAAPSPDMGPIVPRLVTTRNELVRSDLPVLTSGPSRPSAPFDLGRHGFPGAFTTGVPDGVGRDVGAPPPPPRELTPAPTPPVTRTVEARPTISEGVLRGRAITTITPSYPDMARRAGISGQVQVQVLISEDGRVIEAAVLNGNPMLRRTALDAARRWVFSPTRLSGVPVKVQGILTFNFTLN